MNEFWTIIITGLVSMLTGSGIGSLVTLRFTREQAENEAILGKQNIYQKIIDDLMDDRNFYKDLTDTLKEQVIVLEQKVEHLDKEVRENRQALKDLQPSLCGRSNCVQRIYMSVLNKKKTTKKNADHSVAAPPNRPEG